MKGIIVQISKHFTLAPSVNKINKKLKLKLTRVSPKLFPNPGVGVVRGFLPLGLSFRGLSFRGVEV